MVKANIVAATKSRYLHDLECNPVGGSVKHLPQIRSPFVLNPAISGQRCAQTMSDIFAVQGSLVSLQKSLELIKLVNT